MASPAGAVAAAEILVWVFPFWNFYLLNFLIGIRFRK